MDEWLYAMLFDVFGVAVCLLTAYCYMHKIELNTIMIISKYN